MLSETIVISDRILSQSEAWIAAIRREKFPLTIALDGIRLGTMDLLGQLRGGAIAVAAMLGAEPLEPKLSQPRSYRLTLRSNDLASSIAAGIAALAFAKATDGAFYAGSDLAPSVDFELIRQSLVAALRAHDTSALPASSPPQRTGPENRGPNRVAIKLLK